MSYLDEDDELESEIQPTEEVENTEEVEEETPVVESEDLEKLREQNKKLFERAKKAEAKLKEKPAEIPQTNAETLSRDEAILIAQGMDADDLDELKDVAKAKGIPLLKAKETPLFQAYLEQRVAERKKEKAKLGSSKGSQVQSERVNPAEMTREEHQALVKETMAEIK